MKIILASGSPRRRELLTQIGLSFEVRVSEADESCLIKEPAMMVEELSKRKAEAVFEELKLEACASAGDGDFLIIGADTVVALEGEILGKPASEENAKEMLRKLQGRSHEVYTGVTVIRFSGSEKKLSKSFHECTKVSFYPMNESEIDTYVETKDPLDKAGSYGIQGFCARYISGIEGDYNNVVGLPVGRLYQELKSNGLL